MDKDAVVSGASTGDQAAGHLDRPLGRRLGLANPGDFLLVLGAAVGNAKLWIVLDGDPGTAEHVGEDKREGAVGADLADAATAEALGRGLGGCRLAVSGESLGWGEVGGACHQVGPSVLARPAHLDVAENQHAADRVSVAGQLQVSGRITDGETNPVVQGGV